MLIDTHCHLSLMLKKTFTTPLSPTELQQASEIIKQAYDNNVTTIIDVGTSLIESQNCMLLAKTYKSVFAVIGIHPNDLTSEWKDDLKQLKTYLPHKEEHKIVGIGECGLDFHYPDYNIQKQKDAFKAQIEMALEYDIALVVHTRNAGDETLRALEEFKGQITKGIIHCFSEDMAFAQQVIEWNFALGIGGTITYPKNNYLREIISHIPLTSLVLETDAPFLPIQSMRGKQNHPQYIKNIAEYIAQLRNEPFTTIAEHTTTNARRIFNLTSAAYL